MQNVGIHCVLFYLRRCDRHYHVKCISHKLMIFNYIVNKDAKTEMMYMSYYFSSSAVCGFTYSQALSELFYLKSSNVKTSIYASISFSATSYNIKINWNCTAFSMIIKLYQQQYLSSCCNHISIACFFLACYVCPCGARRTAQGHAEHCVCNSSLWL